MNKVDVNVCAKKRRTAKQAGGAAFVQRFKIICGPLLLLADKTGEQKEKRNMVHVMCVV